MLRIETDTGWILVEHRDHARLAGKFAAHWGNAEFPTPEPRGDLLEAVSRHDDAWARRDAAPFLTPQGLPGAFPKELVGKYSAFEEIDFADYLAVRAQAAEGVAADNPYAAVVISMHTVDLLTKRADWAALSPANRVLLREFIASQLRRQEEFLQGLLGDPLRSRFLSPERLLRSFEFLQACDSLSLAVCVRYPAPIPLRHSHPRGDGSLTELTCIPLGGDSYRMAPYPFDTDELRLEVPCRSVAGKVFADQAAFRAAYSAAPVGKLTIVIHR
jgi:hypothetical protein